MLHWFFYCGLFGRVSQRLCFLTSASVPLPSLHHPRFLPITDNTAKALLADFGAGILYWAIGTAIPALNINITNNTIF